MIFIFVFHPQKIPCVDILRTRKKVDPQKYLAAQRYDFVTHSDKKNVLSVYKQNKSMVSTWQPEGLMEVLKKRSFKKIGFVFRTDEFFSSLLFYIYTQYAFDLTLSKCEVIKKVIVIVLEEIALFIYFIYLTNGDSYNYYQRQQSY